jgi:hypothetical protein
MLPPSAKPDKPHAAAPTHDPDLCGINAPGEEVLCPGCRAEAAASAGVTADLRRITARYEQAERRACRSQTVEDYEAAAAERRAIAGEFRAAESALADLGLMFLRVAARHEPDAARVYLLDLLRPELEEMAQGIAKLKGRR